MIFGPLSLNFPPCTSLISLEYYVHLSLLLSLSLRPTLSPIFLVLPPENQIK